MREMIEQAKRERATIEQLAIDARRYSDGQLLVDTYCHSLLRLNAIIAAAEKSEQMKTVCLQHRRYLPCFDCYKETNNAKGTPL